MLDYDDPYLHALHQQLMQKPTPPTSAQVARERLLWATSYDRVRANDPRSPSVGALLLYGHLRPCDLYKGINA
jgi:hypothetical protein